MHRILLVAILFACPAFADVNLAQICKVPMTGAAACAASNQRWIVPVPAAVIFAGTWKPWSSVTTEQVTVCAADVVPATIKCPSTKLVSRCEVAGAKCEANTTGTLALTWGKPNFAAADAMPESDLTGYRIYSGVAGGKLTQLRDVPASPLTASLSGYGSGSYSLAMSALYGAVESVSTPTVTIEVKLPAKTASPPANLSITSVTIE